MNAIVLTFDRLPVGFLSCYGNNWIATPNFDRLAFQSALFDQHFSDSPAARPTLPTLVDRTLRLATQQRRVKHAVTPQIAERQRHLVPLVG